MHGDKVNDDAVKGQRGKNTGRTKAK